MSKGTTPPLYAIPDRFTDNFVPTSPPLDRPLSTVRPTPTKSNPVSLNYLFSSDRTQSDCKPRDWMVVDNPCRPKVYTCRLTACQHRQQVYSCRRNRRGHAGQSPACWQAVRHRNLQTGPGEIVTLSNVENDATQIAHIERIFAGNINTRPRQENA